MVTEVAIIIDDDEYDDEADAHKQDKDVVHEVYHDDDL